MLSILQKTHPLYLLYETAAIAVALFVVCLILPSTQNFIETSTVIQNVDNLSNIFSYDLPQKTYQALRIKISAQLGFSSLSDATTYPFSIRTTFESRDSRDVDKYTPDKLNFTGTDTTIMNYYNQEFIGETNPSIKSIFITRNPKVNNVKTYFTYETETGIPSTICSYLSLVLLLLIFKSPLLICAVVLYFLAFSPLFQSMSGLFYRLYYMVIIYITFKHTTRHSSQASVLADTLSSMGLATLVIGSSIAFFECHLNTPFDIPHSPMNLFVGLIAAQLVGLIATSQQNIPIFFDLISSITTLLPYFALVVLPIYISQFRSISSTMVMAPVLALHGLMSLIISESLLERDDVVSEVVMGAINRESSSGELVEIEKDDSLRIGKIRKIDPASLLLAGAAGLVGFLSIIIAQFMPMPPPTFRIIDPTDIN